MDYLYGPGNAGTAGVNAGERTRLEFQIKETQIEQLEAEVRALRSANANASSNVNTGAPQVALTIPSSVDGVFARLAAALGESEQKAREATDALEAALAAESVGGATNGRTSASTGTSAGDSDVTATAHRVLTRLELLTRENRELAQMLSYGRAQQAAVQLQLLRRENAALRKENASLRRGDS